MSLTELSKTLAAGGVPTAIVAIANYGAGIDVPPLAVWDVAQISALKLLACFAGGTLSFYALKGHRRSRALTVVAVASILCAIAWTFYNTQSGHPETVELLTSDNVLLAYYLTGFALFSCVLGAIGRLGAGR